MVATVNIPGSRHFGYQIGTRAECEAWLEEQKTKHQNLYQGIWTSTYLPASIRPNAAAKKWRYQDGTRVIREFDARAWEFQV